MIVRIGDRSCDRPNAKKTKKIAVNMRKKAGDRSSSLSRIVSHDRIAA